MMRMWGRVPVYRPGPFVGPDRGDIVSIPPAQAVVHGPEAVLNLGA
jgi:hypothetical protein